MANTRRGGGDSLHPNSQQRPMGTNLSCCLGLFGTGQSLLLARSQTSGRFLVPVPHQRPHHEKFAGHHENLGKPLHAVASGPEIEGHQRPKAQWHSSPAELWWHKKCIMQCANVDMYVMSTRSCLTCLDVLAPWASQSCPMPQLISSWWQAESTHPKMDNRPELCHQEYQNGATHCRALCLPCRAER